jgi:hypothetical protein
MTTHPTEQLVKAALEGDGQARQSCLANMRVRYCRLPAAFQRSDVQARRWGGAFDDGSAVLRNCRSPGVPRLPVRVTILCQCIGSPGIIVASRCGGDLTPKELGSDDSVGATVLLPGGTLRCGGVNRLLARQDHRRAPT